MTDMPKLKAASQQHQLQPKEERVIENDGAEPPGSAGGKSSVRQKFNSDSPEVIPVQDDPLYIRSSKRKLLCMHLELLKQ